MFSSCVRVGAVSTKHATLSAPDVQVVQMIELNSALQMDNNGRCVDAVNVSDPARYRSTRLIWI